MTDPTNPPMTDALGNPIFFQGGNQSHLHSRVEKAHERLDTMDGRVSSLERNEAVSAVRMANIQASLAKIDTNLSRLVWIFITAVGGGFAAFIMKGGFNGL